MDLHLYHPFFSLFELKETPPRFQTDPPAYLKCLSYSVREGDIERIAIVKATVILLLMFLLQCSSLISHWL